MLGTAVTQLELEPTDPEPESERLCDQCKMCVSVCPTEMFDRKKSTSTTIGGESFEHSFRNEIMRCNICCGGFTGLSTSGKWSSWSPGRYELKETHEEMIELTFNSGNAYYKRPPIPGGFEHVSMPGTKTYMTCGNCQIVCWGNRKETAENVKLLHNSGCVIQGPDDEIHVYPAEEAAEKFDQLPPEHRVYYC